MGYQPHQTRPALVKALHATLKANNIADDNYRAILSSYGATSSTELSAAQLRELLRILNGQRTNAHAEIDKLRKRLIAAIGGWLRAMNRTENIEIIKAIACRAAQRDSFNKIPKEQLRSLYAAFCKKKKDLAQVDEMMAECLERAMIFN